MRVSYSRMSCYLACPAKHDYRYNQLLQRKKPSRPLMFGKDFHLLLQHRHNKYELKTAMSSIRQNFSEVPNAFLDEIGQDYPDVIKTVFMDYQKHWKNEPIPTQTEHEFMLKVGRIGTEVVYFHGLMDEVYDGGILGEHKTFTRKPNMLNLSMNMQVCLMAKAWRLETGEILNSVMWDYIHSQPAQQPIWLDKSQRFSVAKNEKITKHSYLRACKERGIDDPEILAGAKMYEGNITNFFFKYPVEFVPSMIDSCWDSFKYTAREIVLRGGSNKVMNITDRCDWCDYKAICFAKFTGVDVKYIIEKDYEYSERKEDDLILSEVVE